MSNLILMLALLGVPLAAAALLGRWTEWHRAAGAAGLAMVFLMTGSGHFFLTDLLAQMIPPVSRSGNSWSARPSPSLSRSRTSLSGDGPPAPARFIRKPMTRPLIPPGRLFGKVGGIVR